MNADASANNTPGKVRELQLALYRAAKRNPQRRFHALYDKVHRFDVLQRAWEWVKANNKGSAGVDGETLKQIEEYGVFVFLVEIQRTLQKGTYRPTAAFGNPGDPGSGGADGSEDQKRTGGVLF